MNENVMVGADVEFDLFGEHLRGVVVDRDGHGVSIRYTDHSGDCHRVWLRWAAAQDRSVVPR